MPFLLLATLAAAALAGCSRGSYPLDFFTEMHYQQSYKVQEPPSLSAPADSVPFRKEGDPHPLRVTERGVDYTIDQARLLKNPLSGTPATIQEGKRLFALNCAVCHGASGKGKADDGPAWKRLEQAGYKPKSTGDLTATGPTAGKPDGELFQIITKGFAQSYRLPPDQAVMPPFGKLLTVEERWTLVHYIRSLQQ
ncbi:MAG: cytochrome c [Chloroflexi bacterium]|nr:cytochrome c [Chloroflexota bacterium]